MEPPVEPGLTAGEMAKRFGRFHLHTTMMRPTGTQGSMYMVFVDAHPEPIDLIPVKNAEPVAFAWHIEEWLRAHKGNGDGLREQVANMQDHDYNMQDHDYAARLLELAGKYDMYYQAVEAAYQAWRAETGQ